MGDIYRMDVEGEIEYVTPDCIIAVLRHADAADYQGEHRYDGRRCPCNPIVLYRKPPGFVRKTPVVWPIDIEAKPAVVIEPVAPKRLEMNATYKKPTRVSVRRKVAE